MSTKEYWKNKNANKVIAKKHTNAMQRLFATEIEDCISLTTICSGIIPLHGTGFGIPDVVVDDINTVEAIAKYMDGHTAVLNFASYKEPGGKFLEGSMAQEESLCHSSFLYNVLAQCQGYYQWNNEHKNRGLYKNRALYSPNVRFFHGENTYVADVITCAAPNLSTARKYCDVSPQENTAALNSRIQFLLDIAEREKVDTLILGAWGCGVFGQDPEEVAQIFKNNLPERNIKKVIFAIPAGNNNFEAFDKIFNSKRNSFHGKSDPYKAKMLDIMLNSMAKDEYFNAQLCSPETKNINLDDNALQILRAYYEGKVINIKERR